MPVSNGRILFHKEKVVSNDREGNVYERILKLFWMIGKMIMDGVRDPESFALLLQTAEGAFCILYNKYEVMHRSGGYENVKVQP